MATNDDQPSDQPSDEPSQLKTVTRCGECPFACRGQVMPFVPQCAFEVMFGGGDFRNLGAWSNERQAWVFPDPPPIWCPLRQGDVVVRIGPGG
jgi:hypothetical protein